MALISKSQSLVRGATIITTLNRKDYYSVLLQGVVREDMRFTDVYRMAGEST